MLVGCPKQCFQRRLRFEAQEYLVGEHPARYRDERAVDANKCQAEKVLTQCEWKWAGHPNLVLHVITGLFNRSDERTESKQPGMCQVENATLTVVELPQQKHQTRDEVAD